MENRMKRPKSASPWALDSLDQTPQELKGPHPQLWSERREQHPLSSPSAGCDGTAGKIMGPPEECLTFR